MGDKVFKKFFNYLYPPIHMSQFQAIQYDDVRFTYLPNIMFTFVTPYQKVFSSQYLSSVHQRDIYECYVFIPPRLTQAQMDLFDIPLSLDDLKCALSYMANDSSRH